MGGLNLKKKRPWVDSEETENVATGYRFLLFFLDQNIFNTKVADIQVILPENIPTLHSFVLVLSFYMRK